MIYIDAHNLIKRNYHGGGNPYGLFYNMMVKYQDQDEVRVVCDGPNSRQYRKDIHPGYKAGRSQGDDPVYWEVYNNCIALALEFPNTTVIKMTAGEADDYIALRVDKTDTIISNDKDLWPLIEKGVTILLNASTKVDRALIEQKFKACPRHIHLYKTLVGDPSDKIPGKKGFGPAAWEKMNYEDRELYVHYFARHFNMNLSEEKIWDPNIMTSSALVSWQLALPWTEFTYDVEKGHAGDPLSFCTEKGIIL